MLKQGRAELDPQVATIDPDSAAGAHLCGELSYDAISQLDLLGGKLVGRIATATCKDAVAAYRYAPSARSTCRATPAARWRP